MNLDWLANLLPILNATGIPLLAIGIILLIRAYQRSVEIYKETSAHLKEENERLRKRILETDTGYFAEIDRMKGIVSKSIEAIAELQARKQALLTNVEDSPREAILSDVQKIKQVIALMENLARTSEELDLRFQRHSTEMKAELQDIRASFQRRMFHVGEFADGIGDTQSRIAVVRVITSDEAYEKVKSETTGQKRGLIAPPLEEIPGRKALLSEDPERLTLPETLEDTELPDAQ